MFLKFVNNDLTVSTVSNVYLEKSFDQGLWHQPDRFGYEALAATFIPLLLEHSNIETETPFRFTRFQMERLQIPDQNCTGCSWEEFLEPNQTVVTLADLFQQHLGYPLQKMLNRLSSAKKGIMYLAEETAEITGLEMFPEYLTLLFEIDSLVLNMNRKLNNICVLEQNGKYDYCPIFGLRAALMSSVVVFPMSVHPIRMVNGQYAEPFNITFNGQVHTAQNLYGKQLRIPRFTYDELMEKLPPLLEYYTPRNHDQIATRVCYTICTRQKSLKSN